MTISGATNFSRKTLLHVVRSVEGKCNTVRVLAMERGIGLFEVSFSLRLI
jgi:hypothetical protein